MEEDKNNNLESIISVASGLIPAAWFSSSYYHLMERAGMYELNDKGFYEKLGTPEGINYQAVGAAATFSLMMAGMYLGRKLIKSLAKK